MSGSSIAGIVVISILVVMLIGMLCWQCMGGSAAAAAAAPAAVRAEKKQQKKKKSNKKQQRKQAAVRGAKEPAARRPAPPRRNAALAHDPSISPSGALAPGMAGREGQMDGTFHPLSDPAAFSHNYFEASPKDDSASQLLPATDGMQEEGFLVMNEENLTKANMYDSTTGVLRPIPDDNGAQARLYGHYQATDALRKGPTTMDFRRSIAKKFAQQRLKSGCDDVMTNIGEYMYGY